ncbi:MAG: DNA mismatch repair protein MutS [Chloroflexota bacterium]|nr:DNA mismatch repair protein MutS [Chloroflexota bacterium]
MAETPLRQQYLNIKKQYPDTIVFFRLGDFYETFDGDAAIVSQVCDVVLTARPTSKDQRIPMAGVPYHSAEGYIAKLVQAGYKVAVAEQLTAPTVDQETAARRIRLGKKESSLTANWAESGVPTHQVGKGRELVERDVVRVITPGTVTEPGMLDARRNNYIAAVVSDGQAAGVAYADITTGEFATTEIRKPTGELPTAVQQEIDRLKPAEMLVPGDDMEGQPGSMAAYRLWAKQDDGRRTMDDGKNGASGANGHHRQNGLSMPHQTETDPHNWALDPARQRLLKHFSATSLEPFGCARLPLAIRAAGALLAYIGDTNRSALHQLTRLVTYSTEHYMTLDPHTRRNLEIADSPGGRRNSLLAVLDETRTPMGSRLLGRWLNQPLLDIARLRARQDAVEAFFDNGTLRMEARALLNNLPDLERLCTRAVQGTAGPRDMVAIKTALDRLPDIHATLAQVTGPAAKVIAHLSNRIQPCEDLSELIGRAIADDPPAILGNGDAIRPGFNAELDRIRAMSRDAKGWIAGLEAQEKERTGIKSLKVGYNKVFGYYIEISNANAVSVPPEYIRKQTLVGAERYMTPELKDYESQILNAQERLSELERAAFGEVLGQVAASAPRLLQVAEALALLDVFSDLAEVAVRYSYTRPVLDDGSALHIREGRHPVVERSLRDDLFVPNDTRLDSKEAQIVLLTGPNMAGKSVYIKQVAIIVLMAQIGAFVPAEEAHIGLVDRIFTRVGAQDDIATGRSTFMVEMEETAYILNHATDRSLVILDEIGRGTSTYDGLAIARAVVEYIHNSPRLGAKTLFATHYHELTELEKILPRVRNYNVAVSEDADKGVVFLHKIVEGGADRSYGIHVARLAGLPRAILRRAEDVLQDLETGGTKESRRKTMQKAPEALQIQMAFDSAPAPDPLREQLQELRPDEMSPLEALGVLYELHKKAKEG